MNISKERLDELKALQDEDIDYSDIPQLDDTFWDNVELRMPEAKKIIQIRIDGDVLDWFKEQGKGYQTRMNSILRTYYEIHCKK